MIWIQRIWALLEDNFRTSTPLSRQCPNVPLLSPHTHGSLSSSRHDCSSSRTEKGVPPHWQLTDTRTVDSWWPLPVVLKGPCRVCTRAWISGTLSCSAWPVKSGLILAALCPCSQYTVTSSTWQGHGPLIEWKATTIEQYSLEMPTNHKISFQ